jgi:tetratricopeptide (TPR) repeat protein
MQKPVSVSSFTCLRKDCLDNIIKYQSNEYNIKIDLLYQLSDYDRLRECYKQVENLTPNNYNYQVKQKEHHLSLINKYTTILESQTNMIDPEITYALLKEAGELARNGNINEVLTCYDSIIERTNTIMSLFLKGETLCNIRQYKEAVECYDRILNKDPEYIDAYISKADVLFKLSMYSEVLDCYDKVLMLKPDYERIFLYKTKVLEICNDYESAISYYRRISDYRFCDKAKQRLNELLKEFNS